MPKIGVTIFGPAKGTGRPVRVSGYIVTRISKINKIFPSVETAERFLETGELPSDDEMRRAQLEWDRENAR